MGYLYFLNTFLFIIHHRHRFYLMHHQSVNTSAIQELISGKKIFKAFFRHFAQKYIV